MLCRRRCVLCCGLDNRIDLGCMSRRFHITLGGTVPLDGQEVAQR
jgi:hypothetical protein